LPTIRTFCWKRCSRAVAAEIRAGRLVRLFADAEINPHAGRSAVYAAYLPNRRHSSKVRTFVQFLQERVQGAQEA
jgi:DNA-binding transcriptional LysR family regulator